MALKQMNFYAGTSGLVLPVSNKLAYPEEHRDKSRLHYYSTLFNTIEINSSFYKLPMKKTVERWVADTSDNFKFTFKLSKEITHCRDLKFEEAAVTRFFEAISVPQNKRGCLLIQFPGKITLDYFDQLKVLLQQIKSQTKKEPWQLAIEFRHETWYDNDTIDLLSKHKAAFVMHDLKSFAEKHFETKTNLVYIRYHGTEKNYRGNYADEYLQSQAKQIRRWLKEGKEVYAYFNNTLGAAVQNLQTLDALVRK